MYVWFDALLSYITSAEKLGLLEFSSADLAKPKLASEGLNMINVVGKDILKFHSNMWPLMLNGLDLGENAIS